MLKIYVISEICHGSDVQLYIMMIPAKLKCSALVYKSSVCLTLYLFFSEQAVSRYLVFCSLAGQLNWFIVWWNMMLKEKSNFFYIEHLIKYLLILKTSPIKPHNYFPQRAVPQKLRRVYKICSCCICCYRCWSRCSCRLWPVSAVLHQTKHPEGPLQEKAQGQHPSQESTNQERPPESSSAKPSQVCESRRWPSS